MTDAPDLCARGHNDWVPYRNGRRCHTCYLTALRENRARRQACFEAGRCPKGHDLTKGPVTHPRRGEAREREWICQTCRRQKQQRIRRRKARADRRKADRIAKAAAAATAKQAPKQVQLHDRAPTSARTVALLALGLRLENALPWERAEIQARIDRILAEEPGHG